jgi:hypothetical protein
MVSGDTHVQLLLEYDEARKRHRQLLERFFPSSSFSHGARHEIPAQRPSAADLEEVVRLAAAEQAAHRKWVESFGYRYTDT